jgi:hypothetical protein
MIRPVESPEIFPSVPGNSWICFLFELKLLLRHLTGMQLQLAELLDSMTQSGRFS